MGLLDEIEKAAIDSTTPLADVLRRCKVLAARLRDAEFSKWVGHELNGYGEDTDLPRYRVLEAAQSLGHFSGPFGSGLRNAPIPLALVPEKLRSVVDHRDFRQPVGELQAMTQGGPTLNAKWSPDLVAYIAHNSPMYERMVLMDAWTPIPTAFIKGILDTVRTRILDFALALQTENPTAGDAPPNAPPPIPAATISQHFHTTIIGGQATVGNMGPSSIGDANVASVGNQQSVGLLDETVRALLAELRTHASELPHEEKGEALDALGKIEAQLVKAKPSLERIKQYLSIYTTLVAVASPTAEKLVQILGPMIAGLVQ